MDKCLEFRSHCRYKRSWGKLLVNTTNYIDFNNKQFYPKYEWDFKVFNTIKNGIKIMMQCTGASIINTETNYFQGGARNIAYKVMALHAFGVVIHNDNVIKLSEIYSNTQLFKQGIILIDPEGPLIYEMIDNKLDLTNNNNQAIMVHIELLQRLLTITIRSVNNNCLILKWVIPDAKYRVSIDVPSHNKVILDNFRKFDQNESIMHQYLEEIKNEINPTYFYPLFEDR